MVSLCIGYWVLIHRNYGYQNLASAGRFSGKICACMLVIFCAISVSLRSSFIASCCSGVSRCSHHVISGSSSARSIPGIGTHRTYMQGLHYRRFVPV